ncbi:hypothetical protein BH09PAT3_BH09PAT3_0830 [soil metagenome]
MRRSFHEFRDNLYRLYIAPHGSDVDARRREFILNTLLSGLFVAATIALLFSSLNYFVLHLGNHISTVLQTLFFWVVISGLLVISRRGKPAIASIIFVALLLFTGVQFVMVWGFGLAIAELMFALTIVTAGVLFTAPLALAAIFIVAASLIIVTFLQANNLQHPSTYWQQQPYQPEDVVGYIVVFMIIGLVSWLSNRETDRSLRRARQSEADLQQERDNLESKVIERTHALEELQLMRLLEMQPFAEFGRIGATLVHEIANPLTAASLHLEELNRQQHSELVRQVQRNLQQLERYLVAARKQIKRESNLRTFSIGVELKQVAHLLTNRARRAEVRLIVDKVSNVKIYGDVVKFNQLVANILANAIDASEKISNGELKRVIVHVSRENDETVITILDRGVGIKPQQMEHLFEPFYSTKSSVRGGLGIGLALVKQYVEHDFRGSIAVSSTPNEGTIFTIRLRGQEHP